MNPTSTETRGGRQYWAAAAFVAIVALLIRIPLLDKRSSDYNGWTSGWVSHLHGEGFSAFGDKFADYAPPYLYLLWLTTFSPLSDMLTVKLISIGFELALAGACAWLVFALGGGRTRALAAFAVVIVLPTSVLNGAAWGQSEAVYGLFTFLALALALRGKGIPAMLLAGLGVAVKAQGLLVLPFFVLLTIRGRLNWKSWAFLPVPYVVAVIPPVLLGRSLKESLLIYYEQSDAYHKLTLNAPSVYAWLDLPYSVGLGGTILGGLIVLGATLAAARWAKLETPRQLLAAGTFLMLLAPFLLPKMHDRYFFLAEVSAVLYAIFHPRRWFVPILIVTASLSRYLDYLYDIEPFPLAVGAGLMAAAIGALTLDVFPELHVVARKQFARLGRLRLARFATIGVACTVMFAVLYPVFRTELGPLQANGLALAITMVFNFLANRAWTFRAERRSLLREAPGYVAIYLLGLAFSSLTLFAALSIWPSPPASVETFIALAAGGAATVTRFVLLSSFVYAPAPSQHVAELAPAGGPNTFESRYGIEMRVRRRLGTHHDHD